MLCVISRQPLTYPYDFMIRPGTLNSKHHKNPPSHPPNTTIVVKLHALPLCG